MVNQGLVFRAFFFFKEGTFCSSQWLLEEAPVKGEFRMKVEKCAFE